MRSFFVHQGNQIINMLVLLPMLLSTALGGMSLDAKVKINISQSNNNFPKRLSSAAQIQRLYWPSTGYIGFIWHKPISGYPPHSGVDIWSTKNDCSNNNTSKGNPVYPIFTGRITAIYADHRPEKQTHPAQGFQIYYPDLDLTSNYFHMADENTDQSFVDPTLRVGSLVYPSTLLGYQGNRRWSSSSYEAICVHLHFSISLGEYSSDDNSIDPSDYFGIQLNATKPNPIKYMYDVYHSDDGSISNIQGVTLFIDTNFGGQSLTLTQSNDDLCDDIISGQASDPQNACHIPGVLTWNDNISSMKISPGYGAILLLHSRQTDIDQYGQHQARFSCNQDIADFSQKTFDGTSITLNDNISGIIIGKCNAGIVQSNSAFKDVGVSATATDPNNPCDITISPTADDATFVSNVTIPDGMIVSPSQFLIKTWRVKNTGTSTWSGYKLKFVDGEQMNGPTEISLPTTAPGETRDVSINLKAPISSGAHLGAWQITNAGGTWVQGGKLWVKINVQTNTGNIILDADPPSPSTASTVRLHTRVTPFSTFRAMRVKIDGSVVYELGAPEFYYDWNTGGYAAGDHSIIIEVADLSDTSWSKPQRQSLVYTLQGNTEIVNHVPNRPSLVTNPAYDWYVTIGNPPQLCAQDQGDPDEDAIGQYRFVASASVGTADSGWNNSSCHTFGSLIPGTYEWHAQVKDSRGGVSDWSDKWHFTVEPSGISASINSFSPASPSNAEEVKIYACTSGHAGVNITMRVLVNEANDGSDSGRWNIIKEQGSPCFNDIDVPVWKTLGYADGQHLVRVVAWAIQPDAGATSDAIFTLNHRRPDSPVLKAPVPLSQDIREPIYVNSRTVTFKWDSAIRATSYKLHIGTSPSPANDPNPVFRQTFDSSVNEYTVNFTQDYSTLYWQVEAINDVGSNFSGDQIFGIDRQAPSCSVQAPTPPIYESVFQVNWNGSDNLAGISHFDIQYQDSTRGDWEDWLGEAPASKGYALFAGQAGHTYSFRCRAQDNAGNTGDFPNTANTSVTINPSTRPTTPWWNLAYAQKRGITLLNNMSGMALPSGYPVHLHFDSGTTPTAAELYNASVSNTKCDDVRVVFNETTELNRVVQSCSSTAIDIWFRSSVSIGAGSSDNVSHQLYYGNTSAGTPPGDPNQVWYPYLEAGTTYLYFLQENGGSTAYDSSGNGRNCSINSSVQWSASKFGSGLRFNRANSGDSRSLSCGSAIPLSAFTIEFWYKPDADDGGRIAGELAGGGNGGGGNNWMLEIFDGRLRFNTWPCPGCGGSDVRSDAVLTSTQYVGKWDHVAVTFNGGNEVKFYINGNLDSTKYLSQSGINTYSPPLEIGSSEGISQIKANLGTFRISNGAKTSFPYGAFAQIVNEPTAAVGDMVTHPVVGTIDLAILNMSTYPNPGGGLIVQVDVKNQGTLDTKSGFYTDLYLNHLPTGSGDYAGSLQFWVNDPIPAGGSATLTTVLTDPFISSTANVTDMSTIQETNGTLYAQTDSVGVVTETDKQNNIYSTGVPVCFAQPDAFSADDTYITASTIVPGTPQTHNFDKMGDQDWIKFVATANKTYLLTTSALGASADTYLYLYGPDGTTLLASNDDYGDTLASQIEWQAPTSGTYYILVENWNPNIGGCGTQYTISVDTSSLSISGNAGVAGATLAYTGGSTTADGSGVYSFTVPYNWSGTVTPSKPGVVFNPINRSYSNITFDQTGQNYMAALLPGAFTKTSPSNNAAGVFANPTLAWNTSIGSVSYEYCIDTTDNDICDGNLWRGTGAKTNIPLRGLAYAQTYYWQVRATNSIGTTYANAGAWYSFSTQPGAFNKISPLNRSSTSLTPTLSWTASTGATGYEYCIDTTSGSTCNGTWKSVGNVTNVAIGPLSPSTTYYWQVHSIFAGGYSYANNAWWSFTTSNGFPVAFTKSAPTNGSSGRSTSVTLTWATSTNATSYQYCIDTTNNNKCDGSWISTGTDTSVTPGGLLNGKTYYWQVQAVNSYGATDANNRVWWSFSIQPGNFSKSAPDNASKAVGRTHTLSWNASDGATVYEYCYDTTANNICDGGKWMSAGTARSVTLTFRSGLTYYWQVRAVYSTGSSRAKGYIYADGTTAWWKFTVVP